MIIFDYKDVLQLFRTNCEGTEQIRYFTDCCVLRTYAILTSYKAYIFDS